MLHCLIDAGLDARSAARCFGDPLWAQVDNVVAYATGDVACSKAGGVWIGRPANGGQAAQRGSRSTRTFAGIATAVYQYS